MTNDDIKAFISGTQPAASFDETGEWLVVNVDPAEWPLLAKQLYTQYDYDYLFCLTCIDWKTSLQMVYHLSSTTHRHTIVIKASLERTNPVIETVSGIWKTANFHEREVFELFGVQFLHHPDLRRLILTDDFEGYPLRKDFEDPINMVKL